MERKLAAILSADVKGYSRLMGEDEEATIRTLTTYREVMTTHIGRHRGRVVDSPGDNLLAEFASVVDAVRCAVGIQQELKVRNAELPDQRKMEFRFGINLGDVVTEGERLYGDGVNIAARLESLAEPSGICISGIVYDQIESKLALTYEYLGEQTVKNNRVVAKLRNSVSEYLENGGLEIVKRQFRNNSIADPVRVYKVQLELDGTASPLVSPQPPVPRRGQEPGPARRWPMAALTIVAVLVVGISVLVFRSFLPQLSLPAETESAAESPALSAPDRPSIAVLPFANMNNDTAQEYFSDGITDDIITDLSKISSLFVIARHSTFTYEGQAAQVAEIGRDLGVRYVLEDSVRKELRGS